MHTRSKLEIVPRKDKKGRKYWAARGFVPARLPDGTLGRKRVEHSLGGHTKAERTKEVDYWCKFHEDEAANVPLSFAKAYTNYVERGFAVPMLAEQILAGLGTRQCIKIDDSVMSDLQTSMFKPDAKASYINRHLYTPVSAILHMALKQAAPKLTRPAGHKDVTELEIPPNDWYGAIKPHLRPETLALVMLLTMHGRRLGDALGLRPQDFDRERGTAHIGKTKNGEPWLVTLHPSVTKAILAMDGWEKRRWLFRDGPKSGNNVRKDIAEACKLAEVRYYSPHAFGRHAFATRLLRAGYSLEYVRKAGGWATIELISKRYGHLAKNEVDDAVHATGDSFMANLESSGGKVGVSLPPKTHEILLLPNETA